MDEIIIKNKNNIKKEHDIFEIVTDNRDLIYPFIFYIAGLILGSFFFTNLNSTKLSELMDSIFKLSTTAFEQILLNRFCVYFSIFTVTVLLGMCLIGFPFVNLIPFLAGVEIALRTSYYYVNYSAKGIGFAVLMIIPESAAFISVLLYTIKTSSALSKSIYNAAAKKTDTIEEFNLKSYLKNYLIYAIAVILISLVNALVTYLLGTIITI